MTLVPPSRNGPDLKVLYMFTTWDEGKKEPVSLEFKRKKKRKRKREEKKNKDHQNKMKDRM